MCQCHFDVSVCVLLFLGFLLSSFLCIHAQAAVNKVFLVAFQFLPCFLRKWKRSEKQLLHHPDTNTGPYTASPIYVVYASGSYFWSGVCVLYSCCQLGGADPYVVAEHGPALWKGKILLCSSLHCHHHSIQLKMLSWSPKGYWTAAGYVGTETHTRLITQCDTKGRFRVTDSPEP